MVCRGATGVSSTAQTTVRSPACTVDYSTPRPRRGYGGGAASAAGSARAGMDDRDTHQRHVGGGPRASESSSAHCPADDAGEPDDPPLAAGVAGAAARPPFDRGRRVARAHGDQAWSSDGARPGTPARPSPTRADLGTLSDVRQSRGGAGHAAWYRPKRAVADRKG